MRIKSSLLASAVALGWPSFSDAKLGSTFHNEQDRSLQVDFVGVEPSNSIPLGLCQGDCDVDNDCANDLVCWQRNRREAVPGCLPRGVETSRTDFCVSPEEVADRTPREPPVHFVTSNNDSSPTVLGRCEGHCGDDNDCAEGLGCFHHEPNQIIPGCYGGVYDKSKTDYCVPIDLLNKTIDDILGEEDDEFDTPTSSPSPTFGPSDDSTSFPSSSNAPTSSPGPSMELSVMPSASGPTSSPAPSTPPLNVSALPQSEDFILKMYWEESYMWQNLEDWNNFCATCAGDNQECTVDGGLMVLDCDEVDVRFAFLYMDDADGEQALIAAVTDSETDSEDNLCWERDGNDIALQECDPSVENQLWFPKRGSFEGEAFELSQRDYSRFCVTQRHHPRDDEPLQTELCRLARKSNTSLWIRSDE